MDTQVGNMVY